jgi:hypothetical protein
VKLGHLRFIFKGQLSILLRLLEFVRNRELLKLSNKAIAENPHAQLGALLNSCAPLASRASVAHLRCALRDLTWVTLSQPSICVRENLYLHFLNSVCVCVCNREDTSHTSSRVDGRLE